MPNGKRFLIFLQDKICIQFKDYVEIAKLFVKSEKSNGNEVSALKKLNIILKHLDLKIVYFK